MLFQKTQARVHFTAIRALFFFLLVCCPAFLLSCSVNSPSLINAELYPLYLYDPASQAVTRFMALRLMSERGETDFRSIRVTHEISEIYWDIQLEVDGLLPRVPGENSANYKPPSFAEKKAGERFSFVYPWLFGFGDGRLPEGMYTITATTYSLEELSIRGQFSAIREKSEQTLVEFAAGLKPESLPDKGFWVVLVVRPDESGTPVDSYTAERFRNEYRRQEGDVLYVWGVPSRIDAFLLCGPF